jgi:hypothetical protein
VARYLVTAKGSDLTGLDGKSEGQFLIVRVTDENGEPVEGLNKSNFNVWKLGSVAVLSGPKKFGLQEATVVHPPADLPGVYVIKLDPEGSEEKGSWVYAVAVLTGKKGKRGESRGEALATVIRIK